MSQLFFGIPREYAFLFFHNNWDTARGYQGDELWTAINPSTGKRQIVDPEGEFIPGETIIKLYYLETDLMAT